MENSKFQASSTDACLAHLIHPGVTGRHRDRTAQMFCIGCVDSEEALLDQFNDMLMPGNQARDFHTTASTD